MWGVICGWRSSLHRLFFPSAAAFWEQLLHFETFFFKMELPLGAMYVFFWCHRHMEQDVEVLHCQSDYKVGEHMGKSVDGSGLRSEHWLFFSLTATVCADISDQVTFLSICSQVRWFPLWNHWKYIISQLKKAGRKQWRHVQVLSWYFVKDMSLTVKA